MYSKKKNSVNIQFNIDFGFGLEWKLTEKKKINVQKSTQIILSEQFIGSLTTFKR